MLIRETDLCRTSQMRFGLTIDMYCQEGIANIDKLPLGLKSVPSSHVSPISKTTKELLEILSGMTDISLPK